MDHRVCLLKNHIWCKICIYNVILHTNIHKKSVFLHNELNPYTVCAGLFYTLNKQEQKDINGQVWDTINGPTILYTTVSNSLMEVWTNWPVTDVSGQLVLSRTSQININILYEAFDRSYRWPVWECPALEPVLPSNHRWSIFVYLHVELVHIIHFEIINYY